MSKQKFKQTEIGEIPEDWEIASLGNEQVSTLITKGTTPTSFGLKYVDEGINFIKIESIDGNGSFLQYKFTHIDEETNKKLKRSILQEDDVLFSIAGALGTVALVNRQILPANTNQALAIIRLKKEKILPQYVLYALNSFYVKKIIKKEESKSAQANLSLTQINKLKIPVPSFLEQQRIASVLSCVDSAIQQTDEVIEQARTLKKGLMQELLTRGIGHKKFKKVMLEKKKVEIPESWEICQLGNLLKLEYGKALKGEKRNGGSFPVYGSNGIVGYHDLAIVKGPGILIGRKGSVGAVHYAQSDFWPIDTTYYASIKQEVNVKWLYYLLSSLRLEYLNDLGNVPGLNRNHVHEKIVPKPGVQEQERISQILSSAESKIDSDLEKRSQLERLKKGLMQDLLTGRVRFPEFMKGSKHAV